ncbi:hypothetical protein YQE_04929, partial [Dendroctonus ponderosae]
MSPASLDALEVERYIGACLFSQNRSPNFAKDRFYASNGYLNYPPTFNGEKWAGGAPLISFAGYHRRPQRWDNEEAANQHLARLAVHTQGAPLILTKSFQHRKSKPARNHVVQQTKVFENSTSRTSNQVNGGSLKSVDSVSVTSDESSGSQGSETCLPRIIKPRKRRKKERKPPVHLNRSGQLQSDLGAADVEAAGVLLNFPPFPYLEALDLYQPGGHKSADDEEKALDLFGDISEAPKLHHSFDEVEEGQDVNQPVSTCQCRYCDPEGQIWDVDRSCYSPFLTPPKSFDFSTLFSSSPSGSFFNRFSELSLTEKPAFSRSASSSSSSSSASSFSSTGDLEVSTEIVTSLNGHRDLEIKFWLSGSVDSKSAKNTGNDEVINSEEEWRRSLSSTTE